MSTALFYHTLGTKPYKYIRVEHFSGKTHIHLEKKKHPKCCYYCGNQNLWVRKKRVVTIKTVPIGTRETFLALHLDTYFCRSCQGTFQEKRQIAEPRKSYSSKFARLVIDLSRYMTIADICNILKVGWDMVKGIIKKDLKRRAKRLSLKGLKHVAIDEFAIQKGHKYMTVAYDLDSGRIVYWAKGKDSECLRPFFEKLKRMRIKLKAIAIDMSQAFLKAIREQYSKDVPIIFDHFHLVANMSKVVDTVRRNEQKRLNEAGDADGAKWIKGKRFLLLKGSEKLSGESKSTLDSLLENNEMIQRVYLLKEWFRNLWKFSEKREAEFFLSVWIREARALNIRVLTSFCKTLEKSKDMVLNWYDHPITTAKLEGTNNKIKVLKRKGYGYRDLEFFGLMLMSLHECSYKLTGA